MKRSRLKNIINKSKGFSNKKLVGESPFDEFKRSLPIEVDNNYRLKSAWKAYGSPKNYKEALWNGLILPIDENTYKLPSIGYNEETDEYEYLNKGKENETVAKDIRVWDNDVIPFVLELKQGGYVRIFDEKKDCWKYSKNILEVESFKLGGKKKIKIKTEDGYIEVDSLDEDLREGRKPIGKDKMGRNLYMKGDGTAGPNYGGKQSPESFQKGGQPSYKESPMQLIELIKNSKANFATRLLDPNRRMLDLGNGTRGSHKLSYAINNKGVVVYPEIQEINGELIDLSEDRNAAYESAMQSGDYVIFPSEESAEWFTADNYKRYFPGLEKYAPKSRKFKLGGQMNVIPEGALHARKNNMEGAGEDFTAKGVPVIDNDGNLQAEIEKNEIIFNKETSDKLEDLYKKFNSDELSLSEKDEIAIKAGKLLSKLIIENTDDKTGLIEEVANK